MLPLFIFRKVTNSLLKTIGQYPFFPFVGKSSKKLVLTVYIILSPRTNLVFLDISKAFDKVCHEGLVFKLKQNGVSNILLKLLDNYLRHCWCCS